MKTLLAACLLCFSQTLNAQTENLNALQARCLPEAPRSTLQAIVQVESSGNPYAMQIDFPHALLKRWNLTSGTLRLRRHPKDYSEAIQWLAYFQNFRVSVDLGLMQVSTAEAQRRGIPPESLLEPCTNLRVGWRILEDAYTTEVKVYRPGQTALDHAISRYNTGDSQAGIDNGYLARVLAAAQHLESDTSSVNSRGSR
jgi:type IV secretion system protein VirB1